MYRRVHRIVFLLFGDISENDQKNLGLCGLTLTQIS